MRMRSSEDVQDILGHLVLMPGDAPVNV